MPATQFLVYRKLASEGQVRVIAGLVAALLLIFIATLFFRTQIFPSHALPAREVFVAISGVILAMADWIIATLLFAQARLLQGRPVYVLAAGYFCAGLFMCLRLLSLPGALGAPNLRFDPNYNLPLWFYLCSHAALPLAIIPYSRLSHAAGRPLRTDAAHPPGMPLIRAMIVGASVILALTALKSSLPWSSSVFQGACAVMLLTIIGMVALERGRHSELDFWLLVMLWGWFLEMALIALPSAGFTAGWYAARGLGMISGLFVLFALLAETSNMYAQTVLRLIAETQEREHRFLIRDVVSASIAHELRSPLAAILSNAEFARKMVSGDAKKWDAPQEAQQVLDDIVACSYRAKSVIESTRALFGRGDRERVSIDPAALLQGTIAIIANSARDQSVAVELKVEGEPEPITINRLQCQQALLNLFQNAIDALSRSKQSKRKLMVRCSQWEDQGVIIQVEDNGPGIAPADRQSVFEAFFTTRPDGTGLGLLIANSVIRAHGGSLTVEERAPTGTVFTIHLPHGNPVPGTPAPGRRGASV